MKQKTKDYTILIDCDDTIIDLLEPWVKELNKRFNLTVSVDDITAWDMHLFFPTLTHEELISPLIDQDFWRALKPKADAVEILPKLIKEGYSIYVCTATDYRNFGVKVGDLLLKYFPDLTERQIISCIHKQMILGDILIDDNILNLVDGQYQGFLFTAQHNKTLDSVKLLQNKIHRVNNWYECYDLIHKMCPIT